MGRSRITFAKNRHGDLEARAQLTGVGEAIRRAEAGGGLAAVYGPHSIEEMQSYFRDVRHYAGSGFIAIGLRALDLSDLLYGQYYGRVRALRRVSAFLNSHVLYRDEHLASLLSNKELFWPDAGIIEYLVEQYVGSRKKPEGAGQEIGEFFSRLGSLELQDPVVLRKYHYGWTAEQCIIAAISMQQGVPLVFLTGDPDILHAVREVVSTQPVTLGEAFEAIEQEFHISHDTIARNYRLWRASKYRRNGQGKISLDEVVQVSPIGDFVTFLLEAVADDEQSPDQSSSIPARIVAPLMFREDGDAIGIDHTAVTGVSYQNAIGGVRALKNLTSDLRDSGVLLNAITGVTPCLNRMIRLLDRIEHSPTIEEASIVEFGVEFSYLESRVLNAQPKLSRETMEFVLSYTGQGQALLERFEPWQTYRAEGGGTSDSLGAVNRDIANASIRLLRSAADEGLLDQGAVGRVAEMLDSADVDAPVKRASLAATSQNLGAAVGRSALTKSQQFAVDVARGAEVEAKKKLSDSAASFIHRHAIDLAKLATTESGKWLSALLKTFGSDV